MRHTFVVRSRNNDLLKTAVLSTLLSLGAGVTSAHAAEDAAANTSGSVAGPASGNPYSPTYGHSYRKGVVPTIDGLKRMKDWAAAHPSPAITASSNSVSIDAAQPLQGQGDPTLVYQGGTNGVGVMSGAVKVYLVFYGTQWGNQSVDANGNDKFSGDPDGAASAAQQMFKGIGTNNELWQADLTQWCDGPNVAAGVTACPANANFIPYQRNILAGVWYDNTQASPANATSADLGNEAVAAAKHFGNTTTASNRYTYYIILSPHGTDPDGYQDPNTGYCAWHQSTDAVGVNSAYGNLAFSNQPYNMDQGATCGVGFVNNPGTLDGYTMTLGHEWHEMMSDTFFPADGTPKGWYSTTWGATAPNQGGENSDECAWINPGQVGGAANIAFATGTFAEQASWSNDTQTCAISHAIVNHNGGGTPSASFSFSTNGLTASFTDTSTDAGGSIGKHSWTFGDGSTSTATSPSHTYAAAGTFSVTETVTDSVDSKTSSATKSVTVSSGSGGGSTQLLGNPSIESTLSPWAGTSQLGSVDCSTGCSGESAHTGTGFAWLNGYGSTDTDTLSQSVTITAGKTKATLQYYLHIDTAESGSTAYDTLTVGVYSSTGTLLKTLATYSNVNANSGYAVHSHDLSAYIGQKVTIKFTGKEDSSNETSFVLDDITLTVQ